MEIHFRQNRYTDLHLVANFTIFKSCFFLLFIEHNEVNKSDTGLDSFLPIKRGNIFFAQFIPLYYTI